MERAARVRHLVVHQHPSHPAPQGHGAPTDLPQERDRVNPRVSISIKHNQDDIIALKAALNAQRKQPRWWARIGTLLTWLTNLIIVCQNFPWYTIGACGLGEAEGRDGKYSLTHSLLYSVVMVGGAVNAVAVASVLMTKGGRLDLLPWLCGYVVWFCSAALLFMAGEMRKVFAKPHLWREADAAYKARLFEAFNVRVARLTNKSVEFTLFYVVSLVPTVIVMFLVRWFSRTRYITQCSEDFTADMDGVSTCIVADGVCCKKVDGRTDFFTFIAYLSGNVLAAHRLVTWGAMCLLAKARREHAVEGDLGGAFALKAGHGADQLKEAARKAKLAKEAEANVAITSIATHGILDALHVLHHTHPSAEGNITATNRPPTRPSLTREHSNQKLWV